MAEGYTYDVFLSYTSDDKPRVRKLAERLRIAGLRVWFDEWVIEPGDDIYLATEHGLEKSRVQVLCLSQAALKSNWVTLERNTVLFRHPTNVGRRFVPLLLADCELPDTLRRYKYVDFRVENQAAFESLTHVCQGEMEMTRPFPGAGKTNPLAKPTEQPDSVASPERTMWGHGGWVNSLAISTDGSWAISGSEDNTVRVWSLKSGRCLATLEGHRDQVRSVAITPDGTRILSGSDDNTVRVWDAKSLRMLWEGHHSDGVRAVIGLPDNTHILSGGLDKKFRLWSLDTGRCEKIFMSGSADADDIFCVDVSPAGTSAVSGLRDGRIQLWNLKTGLHVATLRGHADTVNSIRISPDGRLAVSGSNDKTVKIWNLETESCVGTLEGHKGAVSSVAISHDGLMIASTGTKDMTARLWHWKRGSCIQVLGFDKANAVAPISAAISEDGLRLLVGTSRHAVIHVFQLAMDRLAQFEEAARRYVNAKVVLLGEGTVGKTSLAHRLIDDKYVVKDRTHGMNVWPLKLPLAPNELLDREALLWDLAGQEDYRLIHRLFLDETALALLLINPQKDDPFAEAGDWLKALDTVASIQNSKRQASKLLVFSQVDVGGMKISDAKIERFVAEYGFDDWLDTSAKTGKNCSDQANGGQPSKLKHLIADYVPWNNLPWTATPRLLSELKGALMRMRDERDIRLLRFIELVQRLEQTLPGEQFDESDVRTAVSLLANHGLAWPLRFGDLVLLQPELLNGYASAVIRAARSHKDEIGCVQEAEIYRPDFDFTGVNRLERADEELLLRALVQTLLDYALCIAEETPQGRQLIFPSQYRRDKDIPSEPEVFVSYTFGGEWQTIWTTLVVRLWYSHEFEHRELWRNAAEFSSSRNHLLGLMIQNRQGQGEATISLYFDFETPDELKLIFIEYVHRHLAKYGCNVTRDRRYVCACGTPIANFAAVRKRLEAGKNFITCQVCDEHVPLIDFIEQRLTSDPVARRVMKMEETTKQSLDNQALEQILFGHMMAICGEANQIFRPVALFDYGIDGEVEFRDNEGQPSGKKIYVQLKSGNSHLRRRSKDGCEVFDVKNDRLLKYWISQPVHVYLIIQVTDERADRGIIRWMNVTSYLKSRKDRHSRQIIFDGEPLTMEAIWRLRDSIIPRRSVLN